MVRPVKCHKTNNWMSPWSRVPIVLIFISLVLLSTMTYALYQTFIFGRGSLALSFKDSRGITCGIILSQWNGNFPSAISTAFIPACASYFLSSSACFLLCHSYCSSITIVPSSLHCGDNIQSVSSHPRISSQEWNPPPPRIQMANNKYFKVQIFHPRRIQNLRDKVHV